MKTPAVTIVAAWIKAEIGVGPSIASGSQTCSGTWADLPTAPANRRRQITVITSTGHSPPSGLRRLIVCPLSSTAWAKTWSYCREPNTAKISMTPKPNPKSPTRFTMNRSEEHTSELQSPYDLVCRLLLEKKKKQ